MTRPLGEDIEALVAGELSQEDADRVIARIATDPEAAAELDEALQMRAIGNELGASEGQLARRRRTRTIIGFASLAVAAAAALVLYLGRREPKPDDLADRVFASLAPHRQLEPRLSWPAADRYRPYDPPRAATTRPETLSFELLAEVEKAGDARALPAAQLLTGNIDAASAALDKAADTADTLADRAAVALIHHDAERALVAAAAAIDRTPTHPQARWNRALALQALGLDRSAAAAFDDIAAAHEPGWSDEAKTQAAALHAQRKRRDEAWAKAQELGNAMVGGGPIPMDQVAVYPGLMQLYFYDAVRTAPSPARVKELLPLADALDAVSGGDVLHRYAERIAATPFDKRSALTARYAALVAGTLDASGASALVRDIRVAHLDDILVGALLMSGPGHQLVATDLDEYVRLASEMHDPWFDLLAIEQRAQVELNRGDASAAETTLREGATRCEAGAIPYRCMKIWRWLTDAYTTLHRPAASAKSLERARRAAASASPHIADDLLYLASIEADERDDTAGRWTALASAYVGELDRAGPEHCEAATIAREAEAMTLINHNQLADARVLAAVPSSCAPSFSLHRAFVLVNTLEPTDRAGIDDLGTKLVALRDDAATGAGDRVLAEYLLGRLAIRGSRSEGRAMLEHVIDATGDDPRIVAARAYSYQALVKDAGSDGGWSRVMSLLVRERHAALPDGCVLGIGAVVGAEEPVTFVARRRDGSFVGQQITPRVGQQESELPTPEPVRKALADCSIVDVFAEQPFYGRASLLPPGVEWRFRSRSTPPTPEAGPVVFVANIPPSIGLAPLNPVEVPAGAMAVEGAAATPASVVAAIRTAGFVEIHSHGISDAGDEGAFLVLAPDARGSYALTSTEIAKAHLVHHPVVVLAACEAGATGHAAHTANGLADAFISAGASAVVASPHPINDAAAPRFFEALRARIARGELPAHALSEERRAWPDVAERVWIDELVVFQ